MITASDPEFAAAQVRNIATMFTTGGAIPDSGSSARSNAADDWSYTVSAIDQISTEALRLTTPLSPGRV